MAISNRQKNIVNPYATGYSYNGQRQKWIQAGIHDLYINYGVFPTTGIIQGTDLGNIDVMSEDLRAYAEMYPQNATYTNGKLDYVSDDDAYERLVTRIAQPLLASGKVQFYTSPTSEESYLPENQGNIENNSNNQDEIIKQIVAQLISIPQNISPSKLTAIRASFGFDSPSTSQPPKESILQAEDLPTRQESDSIDFYDWKNNVLPGEINENVYYNPTDEKYYCTVRTNILNPEYYDVGVPATLGNRLSARNHSINKILKFLGKYSYSNYEFLAQRADQADGGDDPSQKNIVLKTHLDIRPGSRWLYATTISKSELDALPDSENLMTSEEDNYTPLQKAKLLIQAEDLSSYVVNAKKNDVNRKSVYTMKFLKSALDDTLSVLKDYSTIMHSQNISPDMMAGFDIEREILKLETIYDTIPLFLKVNDVDIDDNERTGVEFCFGTNMRLRYIVIDGNLYTNGLGSSFLRKPPPNDTLDKKDPYLDVFSMSTPRTMGFLYNALDIQRQVAKKAKTSRPPWSRFIQEQVIPKVKFSASESERKKKAKNFRVKEPPNIFQRLDQVFKPTGADLRTMSINSRDLFVTVNSAVGSCDTAQSSLLKDVFRIYRVINGKMPVSGLIKEAAAMAKSELINDQAKLLLLEDAERYASNPSGLINAAERIVLNEVNCIVDLVGDAIKDQILDPIGVPKNVRELVKREVPPPMSFSFRRTPNVQNYWALWKKALQKMLIAFIKQLIMGVIRDVIKAALGCGPVDSRDQRNNGLNYGPNNINYGVVNLNDFLQDINVLNIAEDIGFSDKSVSFAQDKMKITTSKPKQNQVKQFISDVSHMTTPVEITRLLDGEASEVLVNTIVEMSNNGTIDLEGLDEFAGINNRFRTNNVVVNLYQESLAEGDTRYAVLGIDDTTVVNFFREIGAQMDPEVKDILNRNPTVFPEDALCDDRNTIPPNLDFNVNLSRQQVFSQQQDALDASRMKVIGLCDALKGKINFQLQLDDFFDSLPNAEIYELILQWIADLSNRLTDSLMDALNQGNNEATRPVSQGRFGSTDFGASLVNSWERIGAMQYPAPTQWSHSDSNVSLTIRTPVGIQDSNHMDNRDLTPGQEGTVDAAEQYWHHLPGIGLSENFTTFETSPLTEPKNGHIYVTIKRGDGTFELYWQKGGEKKTLVSTALSERNSKPDQFPNSLDSYSLIMNGFESALRYENINEFLKGSPSDFDIASVSNTSEPIYGLIRSFYFADAGRVRLPNFVKAITNPLFVSNIDDCISDRDDFIAKSIVGAIHARLIKFFMNVGPMGRAYGAWNTPDTNRAVVGYLHQKILEQFKERQLFGPMIQNMEKVTKVFGQIGNSTPEFYDANSFSNEKFIYHDKMSPSDLLKSLIEQSYFLIMRRYGYNTNFFERDSITLERFRNAAEALRQTIIANGTEDQKQSIEISSIPGLSPKETFLKRYALYQLPGPLTVAAEIILFDYVVKLTDVYPKFTLETDQRIAIADDQVLSSINPSYLPLYSNQYIGLPVTAIGETYYSMQDVEDAYNRTLAKCADDGVRVQDDIDKGRLALETLDGFVSELETLKDRIKTLLTTGQSKFDEVKRIAEVNDPYWGLVTRGDDEETGGIKAEYLLSRWNWLKREVLSTARGDSLPDADTGLSLERILSHVWVDYRGANDDELQTDWTFNRVYADGTEPYSVTTLSDYEASVEGEDDDGERVGGRVRPAMVELYQSCISLGEAYQSYLDVVRNLIMHGYAQVTWDAATDASAGYDGSELEYKPKSFTGYNVVVPYGAGSELSANYSLYEGTTLNNGVPRYVVTPANEEPILPQDVREQIVSRIEERETTREDFSNCPDAEILRLTLDNLRTRQRLARGE